MSEIKTAEVPSPKCEPSKQSCAPQTCVEGPSLWFQEFLTPYDSYNHGLREVVCAQQTPFQALTIADTGPYGRALFLDGKIQTAEGDERHYHEPIVHVPAVVHSAPKAFLILGGADGAAVREALRWRTTTSVTLVDIDPVVISACQTHLRTLHAGALDDPRVTIVTADAEDFVKSNAGTASYDVVVCDLTDPMENGPAIGLFTQEFFESLKPLLSSPNSTISIQAGPASLVENPTLFPRVCATLRAAFRDVLPFQVYAPSYGSPLGMAVASDVPIDLPEPTQVDALLKKQLIDELTVLDGRAFHGLFGIPKYLARAILEETRVYTKRDSAKGFGTGTYRPQSNGDRP